MNICVITAHFPHFDLKSQSTYATPFLYYYAKEWVKAGHQVTVIHLMRNYPPLFYASVRILSAVNIKQLSKYVVRRSALRENDYCFDGIRIIRLNYRKWIPHSLTGKKQVKKLRGSVLQVLNYSKKDFDCFIGDCFDPVLQIMPSIKELYQASSFFQIVHNTDIRQIMDCRIACGAKTIDTWLFRSAPQKKTFRSLFAFSSCAFMYSGVDRQCIDNSIRYRTEIRNLIYVGALYQSKGLGTILDALYQSKNNKLNLTVVGSGVAENSFKEKVKELGISSQVTFIGAVPHDEVFKFMRSADALVLISHETFGMVYVEAMAQGCIPIGTSNEGIDGIVKHGYNGYLSPLADVSALTRLFDSFSNMPKEEIMRISKNAFFSSLTMTNDSLAAGLIEVFGKKG